MKLLIKTCFVKLRLSLTGEKGVQIRDYVPYARYGIKDISNRFWYGSSFNYVQVLWITNFSTYTVMVNKKHIAE